VRLRALAWVLPAVMALCAARGDDRLWSAVVLVTHEPRAAEIPRALEPFAGTIQEVVGGNSLELLGEKKTGVRLGSEQWLIPSRRIFMKVSVWDSDGFSYRMGVDFYQDDKLLFAAEVRLARDAPLLIRGPRWGAGRVVAILAVR
jgi:hypothetical protein